MQALTIFYRADLLQRFLVPQGISSCGTFNVRGTISLMKQNKIPAILIGSLIGLVIFVTCTNPAKLSSFLLIAPFALIFSALWGGGFLLLRKFDISRFRSSRLALLVAGVPVGLMLLQSIGQLTIRDFITILAFFAIAYFYIARLTAPRSE